MNQTLILKDKSELSFPFEGPFVASPKKPEALTLEEFLELLKKEEDYYPDDVHNTRLMITRLRKVFYDKGGWSKELIRGAADITDRYSEVLYNDPDDPPYRVRIQGIKLPSFLPWSFTAVHKARKTIAREGDKEGLPPGTVPEIYANGNQEVILPDQNYCDLGHLLCGLDAINHRAPVSPLPNFLMWFYRLFPFIQDNADAVTWVGDIASVSGEILFKTSCDRSPLSIAAKQEILDVYAPHQDMLGNIDPYVIAQAYNIGTENGYRLTEILEDYYCDIGIDAEESFGRGFRENRYTYFAKAIGLGSFNGMTFSNEAHWRKDYEKQLRDATIFYCLSRSSGIGRFIQAILSWMGFTKKTLDIHNLTDHFLISLKNYVRDEPLTKQISTEGEQHVNS